MPKKTDDWTEVAVLYLKNKTNLGPMRLAFKLKKETGISLHPNTVAKILKRNGMKTRRYRTIPGMRRSAYKYEEMEPLTYFQTDIKEIADLKALPRGAYEMLFRLGLPRY